MEGLEVYAFDGTTYTSYHGTTDVNGEVTFTLPEGNYHFRADFNGTQFWSSADNHCTVPGCAAVDILVTIPVYVSVLDTDGLPVEGLNVYAFDETTYTGYFGTTDAYGQVVFTLPEGSYRFRADRNGTQFWSGEGNHCEIPSCAYVEITVTIPLTVTVYNTDDELMEGLEVYAFDGTTYTGYQVTTNANGEAVFTLPLGSYRFRADLNGTQFWSSEENLCEVPGCSNENIVVTNPMTVTVRDTDGLARSGLSVYAFDGDIYTGYHTTTDTNGEAVFTLPMGTYRFRADLNGTQFWSGTENHCEIPGCTVVEITVTIPVTVTVANHTGQPYVGLNVYAFDADTYTGYHGVTDEQGMVTLTLPEGFYRFRADYDGVQFWSGPENHCDIPGCLNASITLPGSLIETNVTIDYTYDGLYRLTAADYSDGTYFHYTYDPVGNRLTHETQTETNTYVYDDANHLVEVDGVAYLWDANGNLLFDGESFYSYDFANRLTAVHGLSSTVTYTYSGLGDRLQQTIDGATMTYTLDLNSGFTQVLTDGETTHLYGLARLAQLDTGTFDTAYFLGDALGSVRQLIDETGAVTYAASYTPYGELLSSAGEGESAFGYTGEQVDVTGLVYL
ncbi:MAG: hypothetical protein AB1531_05855, partial [Chloroflexota bacterium]